MKTLNRAGAALALACSTLFADGAHAAHDIVLIYKGDAIANTQPPPATAVFQAWCGGVCAPSVDLPMQDARTGNAAGRIRVWATPFTTSADGKTLCFSEYIVFELAAGTIHTASNYQGVCGATMDAALKPATHAAQPAVVVGGGGDGVIVDGTRKYRNWTGTYTDRVFVELSFAPGGTNYYDQLIFSISKD